jgi:FkbM family methyltransferase
MLLKKLAAEYQFRKGRRNKDIGMLQLASSNSRQLNRAAIELAKLGVPDQVCGALLKNLDTLRTYRDRSSISDDTVEVLQQAVLHLQNSRGQFFQDVAAFHFSGSKRNGFFVEVGTGNGEHLSNTYMLEKSYGWSGVLFEPNRKFAQEIENCRTAVLDRRAAYSSDNESLTFIENSTAGELSTLSQYAESDKRTEGSKYTVECVTLNSAFEQHSVPSKIDFLSIDTEGSEIDVLNGLDLCRFDIKFMVVEHNGDFEKKQEIINRLQKYGYKEVCKEISCIDAWMTKH